MKPLTRFAWSGGLLVALSLFTNTSVQSNADDPNLPDGVDIQVRGPVHEAFAQPNDDRAAPGQLVPKEPPAPIPEEPPEERPEGANVQFIPGYWAWDPESNQFMWVSGTYRNTPIGRQWVPGHWERAAEGWRWVPGFWASEQQQELHYTPEPPAPLQNDPNVAAPGDDFNWVPGNWLYRDTRFVWRPGYWTPFRAGRVWTSARYYWTPSGYAYVDGYWDYPLEDRGVLFAPVIFNRPYWNTPGWCWRPSFVVGFGGLFDSCFVRAGGFSLYFGNYYGPAYAGFGYRPWFNGYGRYNPVFAYHRWHNRYPNDWYGRQQRIYGDRAAGRSPVPPRTFAQQTAFLNGKNGGNNPRFVAPLGQMKNVNKNVQLVKQSPAQWENQKSFVNRTRDLSTSRAKGSDSFRLPATISSKGPSGNGPNFTTQPKLSGQGVTSTGGQPRTIDKSTGPTVGKGPDRQQPKFGDSPRGPDFKTSPPSTTSNSEPKTFTRPSTSGPGATSPPSTSSSAPKTFTRPSTSGPGATSPPSSSSSEPKTFTRPSTSGPGTGAFSPPTSSSSAPKTFTRPSTSGPGAGTFSPPSSSSPAPRTFSPPSSSSPAPRTFSPPSSSPAPKSPAPPARKSGRVDSFAPGAVRGPTYRSIDPSPGRAPFSSAPSAAPRGGDFGRSFTSQPSAGRTAASSAPSRSYSAPSLGRSSSWSGGSYSSSPAPRMSSPAPSRSSVSAPGGSSGSRFSAGSSSSRGSSAPRAAGKSRR